MEWSNLQSLAMKRKKFPTEVHRESGYGLDVSGFQSREG
jgi:hypothetical protein